MKMKNRILLAFSLILLALSAGAQTFTAQFFLSNYTLTPTAVSQVTLTPLQPNYNYTNTTLVQTPIYAVTTTNGVATFSNLVAGYSYQLDLTIQSGSGPVDYFFTNNFPNGLSGVVNAQPYSGFWIAGTQPQIFAYYTAPIVTFATNSVITYVTNIVFLTNNLSGTNFGIAAGTNATIATNGFTFTVNVPTQTGLTNPLQSAAYFPTNTWPNVATFNTATTSVAQVAAAATAAQGAANTNFTLGATNSLYATFFAALAATNSTIAAAIIASNAQQTANLIITSNGIVAKVQAGSITLSNLAVTGAVTNGMVSGTNGTTLSTNVLGQVSWSAREQVELTNVLGSAAYFPSNSFVSQSSIFGITNGFTSNQGFATQTALNLTNAQILATTTNLVQSAGVSSTNFANQIGAQGTNYANVIGGFGTNNLNSASNILSAGINAANAISTNLVFQALETSTNSFDSKNSASIVQTNLNGLQNRALTNRNVALAIFSGGVSVGVNTMTTSGFSTPGGSLSTSGYNGSGTISNAQIAFSAASLLGSGTLAYSNNITSNNVAGQINIGQVFGSAPSNYFLLSSNGLEQNFLGLGTKTNWLITTNVIDIYGNPGLPVIGAYLGLPFGTLWTNVDNPSETIQYAAPNYFLFTNYGNIVLYQSANAVNWVVAGSGINPAPIGATGSKWRIGGVIEGYVYSTNLAAQWAAFFATNGGGGGGGTNISTNFILSGVITNYTTNTIFSAFGTNAIIAIAVANVGGPTSGTTLAQVTNVVTGMTNGLAAASLVTNYVQQVTNAVTSQYTVAIANATNNLASGLIPDTNGIGTLTTLIQSPYAGISNLDYLGNLIFSRTSDSNQMPIFLGSTVQGGFIVGGYSNIMNSSIGVAGLAYSGILGGYGNIMGGGTLGSRNALGSLIFGGTNNQIGFATSGQIVVADYSYAFGVNNNITNSYVFAFNDGSQGVLTSPTNSIVILIVSNGLAINTNRTVNYSVNVHGPVQSDNGFYVNGVLVGGGGGGGGATNAIGNSYGVGTNTTLYANTYLASSNLDIYSTGVNGGAIPNMTSDTTPSGQVFSSSQNDPVNNPDWLAFGAGNWLSGVSDSTPTLTYLFPSPVYVTGFTASEGNSWTLNQFQTSLDSNTWVIAYVETGNNNGTPVFFKPVLANYVRWIFNAASSPPGTFSAFQTFTEPVNYASAWPNGTNGSIVFTSTNGVGFNVTPAPGNSVDVGGNLNASGLSINGVPIQSMFVGTPAAPYAYTISGGTGASAVFNGNYARWINPPPLIATTNIYLNQVGQKFGPESDWRGNNWPSGSAANYAIFSFPANQIWTNSTITGTYTAYGSTLPTNSLTVSAFVGAVNLISASSSVYDGGSLTNLGTKGIAKLSNGSNQISTSSIQLNSMVLLTYLSLDGNVASAYYRTNETIAGSKFTVRSSNPTDTNIINWMIVP